jgi:hypothetical protein
MNESLSALKERARLTLEANLVETERGLFLAAGGNQFRTLWTRDFCFSVPGLLQAGWRDLVERQLALLLSFVEFGQLPRSIDTVNPKWRVVWHTALRGLPNPLARSYAGRLRPEYLGEHGTPAFDSNLVFLKAWAALVSAGGSWGPVANRVPELLQPFTSFLTQGELCQPAFSDWQDSARREGAVLHTHLLLFEVLHELAAVDLLPAAFLGYEKFVRGFLQERFDPQAGLFREFTEGRQFALDSHLLLLKSACLADAIGPLTAAGLYRNLKGSALWQGLPGVPVHPAYPDDQVALTTKIVGLRHYHDGFAWGWLAAEAAHAAFLREDPAEGAAILTRLAKTGRGDEALAEIFEEEGGRWRPVERRLYRAECPFTWTAAKCLEALSSFGEAGV